MRRDVRLIVASKKNGRHRMSAMSKISGLGARIYMTMQEVAEKAGHSKWEKAVEAAETGLRSLAKRDPVSTYVRLIWAPDEDLKNRQRMWGNRFSRFPVHRCAWGFVRGRRCIDCCSSHLNHWGVTGPGQMNLFSMDLENFFPSITDTMVVKALLAHGVSEQEALDCARDCTMPITPELVAHILGSIRPLNGGDDRPEPATTSDAWDRGIGNLFRLFNRQSKGPALPPDGVSPEAFGIWFGEHPELARYFCRAIFRHICGFGERVGFGDRVLIQGSPASPALSNLVAKRMDYRLEGLAKSMDMFYSRYADDVSMSWRGRITRKRVRLAQWATGRVIGDSGFSVNQRKTIILGSGMRQKMLGYALNSGAVTVPRSYRRRVRARVEELSLMSSPSPLDLQRVSGQIEFIRSAHPEEGQRLFEQIRILGARANGTPFSSEIFVPAEMEDFHEDHVAHGPLEHDDI